MISFPKLSEFELEDISDEEIDGNFFNKFAVIHKNIFCLIFRNR